MMQRIEDRRQRYLVTRDEGGGTRDVHRPSSIVFRNLSIIAVSLCFMFLPEVIYAASPVAKDISAKVIKDTQNSTLNSLKLQASDADAGDALTYTILNLPAHGQLKDEVEQAIITSPYVLSSNKLKYIPNSGYFGSDSFTYKANDASSDSNTATVSLNIVEWFAPIGIPEPEFGIKETYRMYDDPAKRNPALTYTQNAEGGYYTHYVDNTSPAATDKENPYGVVAVPRLTVPQKLAEGSVVEVHGGPYSAQWGDIFEGVGTAAKPVFIRGLSTQKPHFTSGVVIRAKYTIVENIYAENSMIRVRSQAGEGYTAGLQYICVRNCDVVGNGLEGGGGGLHIAHEETKSNIVFYNNLVSYLDKWDSVNERFGSGVDVGIDSNHIWILDNHIHHNGEDGFQTGHGANYTVHHVYIGRNNIHNDGENAVDIKEATDVIVSQNIMHDYYILNPRMDGVIIVAHYGPSLPSIRVWFIFNELYNADRAAAMSASEDTYYIGNIIHDIKGLVLNDWYHKNVYFAGNTMYNVGGGIEDTVYDNGVTVAIVNNIFGNCTGRQISVDGSADNAIVSNNLFQDTISINTKCNNCIKADPLFIDGVNGDFHLQLTSPPRDAGIESDVYQTFYNLYGLDIRKDIEGNARPQGSAWDIGAYEYTPQGAVLYGDVSGDAEVSAYDAALTAQASVELISLTPEQTRKADVSGDAEVSAYDAALIAQRAVGLIDRFPVEG